MALSPIVVGEPNRAALDKLLAESRAKTDELWQHFADRYATAEQQVAAEMAQFDVVDHLFPPEEQARIREAIRAPLFEGLQAIDLDAMLIETPEEFAARMGKFYDDWMNDAKAAVDEVNSAAQELGLTFTSAFEDAIVEARNLSDIVHGLIQDLLRMAVRKTFTIPFTDFFGGLLEGRASGGPVTAGTPYMVGEHGPELFVPSAVGWIMPNGAGASVQLTQNNYISGSNIGPPEMIQLLELNNRQLKVEVLDELRRGAYS